jgi:transcriptional regulator with XRE-family HTH domain
MITEDSKESAKYFAVRLKDLRNEANLSQADLGKLVGKSDGMIWNYENLQAFPTRQDLDKFCDLFNKSDDYFFPEGVPELKKDRYQESRVIKPSKAKYEQTVKKLLAEKQIGKPTEEEKDITLDVEEELPKEEPKEIIKEVPVTVQKGRNVKSAQIEIPVGDKVMKITISFE